jgi:hypothetical protein
MEERRHSGKASRREIVIDLRYEGPPGITLGGYISGLMAAHLDCDTVEVTMRHPTPMGRPLILDTGTPDRVRLCEGETVLNEARPANLDLDIPERISLEEAKKASLRHVTAMPYPNCFGCGSGRSETDGLHLRSGPVEGRKLVAVDWVPKAEAVGAPDGQDVPLVLAWASMECPIARAMQIGEMKGPDELILLGRMTTRIKGLPRVGEPHFFMGWPVRRDGRKIYIAGTLHNREGEVLVMSHLTFITLKEGATYDSFSRG